MLQFKLIEESDGDEVEQSVYDVYDLDHEENPNSWAGTISFRYKDKTYWFTPSSQMDYNLEDVKEIYYFLEDLSLLSRKEEE